MAILKPPMPGAGGSLLAGAPKPPLKAKIPTVPPPGSAMRRPPTKPTTFVTRPDVLGAPGAPGAKKPHTGGPGRPARGGPGMCSPRVAPKGRMGGR